MALCHMQLFGLWSRASIMNSETIPVRSSAHPDFVMQDAEEPGEMAGKVGICGESDLENSTDPTTVGWKGSLGCHGYAMIIHDQCSAISYLKIGKPWKRRPVHLCTTLECLPQDPWLCQGSVPFSSFFWTRSIFSSVFLTQSQSRWAIAALLLPPRWQVLNPQSIFCPYSMLTIQTFAGSTRPTLMVFQYKSPSKPHRKFAMKVGNVQRCHRNLTLSPFEATASAVPSTPLEGRSGELTPRGSQAFWRQSFTILSRSRFNFCSWLNFGTCMMTVQELKGVSSKTVFDFTGMFWSVAGSTSMLVGKSSTVSSVFYIGCIRNVTRDLLSKETLRKHANYCKPRRKHWSLVPLHVKYTVFFDVFACTRLRKILCVFVNTMWGQLRTCSYTASLLNVDNFCHRTCGTKDRGSELLSAPGQCDLLPGGQVWLREFERGSVVLKNQAYGCIWPVTVAKVWFVWKNLAG